MEVQETSREELPEFGVNLNSLEWGFILGTLLRANVSFPDNRKIVSRVYDRIKDQLPYYNPTTTGNEESK